MKDFSLSLLQDVLFTPNGPTEAKQNVPALQDDFAVSNVPIVSNVLIMPGSDRNDVHRCQSKTSLAKSESALSNNVGVASWEARDTLCSSRDDSRRHKDASKQRHCNGHERNAMSEYDAVMQRVRRFMLDT